LNTIQHRLVLAADMYALGKKYLALKPDEEAKKEIKLERVPETPIRKYVFAFVAMST
jgi:hypothetical protein